MIACLVRHAHAGDRERWHRPDDLRPLTERGWRQAREIAARLPEYAPAVLLTSPYVRCRQTMEPLAERLGVPLREDQRLIEGHPPQAVLDLLVGGQSNVAVCTHGDIVAAIVEDLWRAGVIGRPAWAKGSTWVLEVHGGRITEAKYLEP